MSEPTPSPSPPLPKSKSPQKRHKRVYQLKIFWFFLFTLLSVTLIGAINAALNLEDNQKQAAQALETFTQTHLEFRNLKFNLFWGEVAGEDFYLHVKKNNLKLSLTEFKLSYNPLYLLIARFKITKITAKEFWLDTSELIKSAEDPKPIKVPTFLKRIKLKEAKLQRFFWSYPDGGYLAIENVSLDSKFGSSLSTSPLHLIVDDITYFTDKLHAYVERVELDGFFLFDFSQPRLLDESKLDIKADAQRILIAPYRKPKPWLTDAAWDIDLEPVLKNYYPTGIPTDRSFLFLNSLSIDSEKTKNSLSLNSFNINYYGHKLIGKGHYYNDSKKADFKLKTSKPLDISKLPLGQSKFRQSFEQFEIDLNLDGTFASIQKNSIDADIKAKLIGNLVHPTAGDVAASIKGRLTDGIFSTNNLNIKILDGTITADGKLNFHDLTTQTNVKADQIDAQTVIRLFSSVNIPSKVNATGSITGKINDPKINLDLNTKNATYEFLNFGDAHGKLLIESNDLMLDVQSVNSPIGQSKLKMTVDEVFSPFENNMKLTSEFQKINIASLFNAKSLTGTIGGTFILDRANAIVSAKGDFKTDKFHFFEHPVGNIDFKLAIKGKHLDVTPITITLDSPQKTLVSNKGLSFDFDDTGYRFKGELTNALQIIGEFKKANKNFIHLNFLPNNLNLELFSSLIPLTLESSLLSGKIDLDYSIYDPYQSKMQSTLTTLELTTPEGLLKLHKTSGLDYQNKAFQFKNFDLSAGQGRFILNGAVGLNLNTDLKIKGEIDFTPLVDFNPYISESEKPLFVDLTLREDILKPKVYGSIKLDNDSIRFRRMDVDLEELNGTVKFDGTRISTELLTFNYDDAPMRLAGWITTDYEKITAADMTIKGKEFLFYPAEGMPILSDINLKLTGHGDMLLKGDINIVEGQYSRNFTLTNFILKPDEDDDDDDDSSSKTLGGLPLSTRYQFKIKNTGDLTIQNNVANLELNADLDLVGTIENPNLIGQIDFVSGSINAFGIDFSNASGFAQFKQGKGLSPEVNIVAKKEIQGYNIAARVEGKIENLKLRLESSPALSNREILSVIFYGATPDFLTNEGRRNFTQTAAISQLASILASPVEKISGLDVLRVSSRRNSSSNTIQRLSVGKKLTERFDLSFTTDLGIDDPERAFELRYQIFDNFYFIAAKDLVGGNRYRFDVNYRFELY